MSPGVYGLLATACVALALYAYPRMRAAEIDPFDVPGEAGDAPDKSITRKLFNGLSRRLGPAIARSRGEFALEKVNTRLDHAGRPGHMNAERFLGNQAASAVLLSGLFLLLFLLGGQWYMILVGAFIGWGGWEVWIRRRGRLRQERIEKDLPDFLDILSVTVRAGLGYRAALGRVAESLGGPTGEEMTTALRQMGLGVSRREAFEGLRERSSSDSMSSFVAAQLQAEELGVPLADALNDIAEDMRRRAHQNARRHAQRAAPRVSLVTTMLIVPGAIILLLVSIIIGSDITGSGLLG